MIWNVASNISESILAWNIEEKRLLFFKSTADVMGISLMILLLLGCSLLLQIKIQDIDRVIDIMEHFFLDSNCVYVFKCSFVLFC